MVRQRSGFIYRSVLGRYTGEWIDAYISRLQRLDCGVNTYPQGFTLCCGVVRFQRLGLYSLLLNSWTSCYRLGLAPNSSYQFSALKVRHPPAMGAVHRTMASNVLLSPVRAGYFPAIGEWIDASISRLQRLDCEVNTYLSQGFTPCRIFGAFSARNSRPLHGLTKVIETLYGHKRTEKGYEQNGISDQADGFQRC